MILTVQVWHRRGGFGVGHVLCFVQDGKYWVPCVIFCPPSASCYSHFHNPLQFYVEQGGDPRCAPPLLGMRALQTQQIPTLHSIVRILSSFCLCSGELCYLPMCFLSTQRPGVPIGHIYGWPLRVCLVGTWNFQLQHILFGEFYAIDCHLNLLNITSSISLFFMRGGGSSQGLLLGTPCARCAMEPPLLRGESQNEK